MSVISIKKYTILGCPRGYHIERKRVIILEQTTLFENMKFCSICRGSLPVNYKEDLCPMCKENQLFNQVKDYIRSKNVTEYQVAEHFDIPRSLVKKWITEGRIEYKEDLERISSLHCSNCGEPITFGTLCQKCYREQNLTKTGYVTLKESSGKDKMRFMDDDSSHKGKKK